MELDESWEPTGYVAYEYPVAGVSFFNSMAPSLSHIGRLGADYDGDTCSATAVWTDEAKAEIGKVLNSRDYYVSISGQMSFSAGNDVTDLTLASMTG